MKNDLPKISSSNQNNQKLDQSIYSKITGALEKMLNEFK